MRAVDLPPDAARGVDRLVVGQFGVEPEEAVGIAEHRLPQREEAVDVPLLDVVLVGVEVDREVEVVADELGEPLCGLQHVEAFEDHDVRLFHDTRSPSTMSYTTWL